MDTRAGEKLRAAHAIPAADKAGLSVEATSDEIRSKSGKKTKLSSWLTNIAGMAARLSPSPSPTENDNPFESIRIAKVEESNVKEEKTEPDVKLDEGGTSAENEMSIAKDTNVGESTRASDDLEDVQIPETDDEVAADILDSRYK